MILRTSLISPSTVTTGRRPLFNPQNSKATNARKPHKSTAISMPPTPYGQMQRSEPQLKYLTQITKTQESPQTTPLPSHYIPAVIQVRRKPICPNACGQGLKSNIPKVSQPFIQRASQPSHRPSLPFCLLTLDPDPDPDPDLELLELLHNSYCLLLPGRPPPLDLGPPRVAASLHLSLQYHFVRAFGTLSMLTHAKWNHSRLHVLLSHAIILP